MRLTETQLRKTIQSILNELFARRKGQKSWLKHSLGGEGGDMQIGGGGYGGDYDYDDDGGDYGDMGEADEADHDDED